MLFIYDKYNILLLQNQSFYKMKSVFIHLKWFNIKISFVHLLFVHKNLLKN